MIIIEYMENASLDAFLRVSIFSEVSAASFPTFFCTLPKCPREQGVCCGIGFLHKYHKSCTKASAALQPKFSPLVSEDG